MQGVAQAEMKGARTSRQGHELNVHDEMGGRLPRCREGSGAACGCVPTSADHETCAIAPPSQRKRCVRHTTGPPEGRRVGRGVFGTPPAPGGMPSGSRRRQRPPADALCVVGSCPEDGAAQRVIGLLPLTQAQGGWQYCRLSSWQAVR